MFTQKLAPTEIQQIISQIAKKPRQAFKIISVLVMNGNISTTPWDLASDKIVKDSDLGHNFKPIKYPNTVCYDLARLNPKTNIDYYKLNPTQYPSKWYKVDKNNAILELYDQTYKLYRLRYFAEIKNECIKLSNRFPIFKNIK